MKKIAVYGKGGIGKSTIVSNVAAAMTGMGLKVLQLGCDPKADSVSAHIGGRRMKTILDTVRERKNAGIQNPDMGLDGIIIRGDDGVYCAECGGPVPGTGCAGRGIVTAFEVLRKNGVYEELKPDVILYDVLGDVVCGGFAMPLRNGYARDVFIVTSGEKMALYAGANIALAIRNFEGRDYARLTGLVQNCRNVKNENELISDMAEELGVPVSGIIRRSGLVQQAEELNTTVVEAFADSDAAADYTALAERMLRDSQDV